MLHPLVLDFDGSVAGLSGARVLRLRQHQETIRFSCGLRELRTLVRQLDPTLREDAGVVLLGSGDFHHVSFALIELMARRTAMEVIVLDNHPDNMRWLGGIHCGSWVRHVTRLPNVSHVHVLGITSPDIASRQLWENYFTPLLRGRLTYWSVGQTMTWMHRLGWRSAFRNFNSADELCRAFAQAQSAAAGPVYLSIDKDVLSPEVVSCNWDQGCFEERHVAAIVTSLHGRIAGSDISGELSAYRYRSVLKRWISARDAQPPVDLRQLPAEQTRHNRLNARLLAQIHPGMRARSAVP